MNKLCVVARNPETYFIKRLTEEVRDVRLYNPWSDDAVPPAKVYLVRTTGVFENDLDLERLKELEGVIINPLEAHLKLRDKDHQFTLLSQNEIRVIPWRTLNSRKDFLPEKILVKPVRGQGGWGIRVFNPEAFLRWEEEMKKSGDHSWIIQPYLENASEFRLFFAGEKILVLKRTGAGPTANFKSGGTAFVVPETPAFTEIFLKVRTLTGAVYGAIDILEKDGELFVLEVNPVPGIEQLEKVTGLNMIHWLLPLLFS